MLEKRMKHKEKNSEGVDEKRNETQGNRERQLREEANVKHTMTFNSKSQAPKGQ